MRPPHTHTHTHTHTQTHSHSSTSMLAPGGVVRANVCICAVSTKNTLTSTIHQRHARTSSETKHQHQHKKYTNQHRTHTPDKKMRSLHTHKRKLHTPAAVCTHLVRVCVRVCLRLNLLLKPAPVSGSVCGGGDVCLCLAL